MRLRPFVGRCMPAGTRITILITKPGAIGKRVVYTLRRRRNPAQRLGLHGAREEGLLSAAEQSQQRPGRECRSAALTATITATPQDPRTQAPGASTKLRVRIV